ncbi:Acyl-phosphate:glycerol-3-phosphate O-acyltransferase PlsY [Candidatus Phaeomarinobacter ectocarpi]|uniref:Glycerol-3-phosphate acyltransferase n=1 Tax=Candidatus Phaeomarinibacter ectocarpi TaxID=1458461 RepID=X5MPF1_9HYPH|nr:glycerol-3-phosphate 1-O-acyltransferase PlsY [Candidatus Phaeomarinobacter ectocarpi]CDO61426.1 Acyl-phosphate:glycerol-3-phosphate O-acyltransferase PlsY [Candidatus Phaeomarinobacter ectocarpi]
MLIDPISIEYSAPYYAMALAFGYLLGSIPFGLVFTRMAGLGDIRSVGSGNIGATNVLRTGNRWVAAATLVADGAKGAIAVLIARYVAGDTMAVLAGTAAFVGHIFPVWLGFKGGKGVATFLGLTLALSFPIGLAACATWLVTAAVTRISSLSALVAAALAPAYFWYADYWLIIPFAVFYAVLIFIRHKDNIQRILAGEEPRIGAKKKTAEEA